MKRQKNRELTGWEENSSVSFLDGHLTLVMMDTKAMKLKYSSDRRIQVKAEN